MNNYITDDLDEAIHNIDVLGLYQASRKELRAPTIAISKRNPSISRTYKKKETLIRPQIQQLISADDAEMRFASMKIKASPRFVDEAKKGMEDFVTSRSKKLHDLLSECTLEQRKDKARRHFKDALFLRKPRDDLDLENTGLIKKLYQFQTNPSWQEIMMIVSWLYMAITFFEPATTADSHYFDYIGAHLTSVRAVEVTIVIFLAIDTIIHLLHVSNRKERTLYQRCFSNKKLLVKVLVNILFLVDTSLMLAYDMNLTFRFSRFFRPVCLLFYSKQLRRVFLAILKSYETATELIVFFAITAGFYALLGCRLLGGVEDYDHYESNFKDYGHTFTSFYWMLSGEGYPSIMYPALNESILYVYYFIPYVLFGVYLLIPIPIAILFNAFKEKRGLTVVTDRLREREALFMAFACLDINNERVIYKEIFLELLDRVYKEPTAREIFIELFEILDSDGNGFMELDEFFQVPEMILNNKTLMNLTRPKLRIIERTLIIDKLRLRKLVSSRFFDSFVYLANIFNIALYIISLFLSDETERNRLQIAELVLIYVYLGEICARIVVLGFFTFFENNWNRIDFCLLIISLIIRIPISTGRFFIFKFDLSFSSGESQRKESRNQKKCWIVDFVIGIYRLFERILSKSLRVYTKIMVCLPMALRLLALLVMMLYIFAVMAMEVFNDGRKILDKSEYLDPQYTNFSSFGKSLLCFMQVISLQVWTNVVYDTAERYAVNYFWVALIFLSYFSFVSVTITATIQGLILEVFSIVDENIEEQKKLEAMEKSQSKRFAEEKTLGPQIIVSSEVLEQNPSSIRISEKLSGFDQTHNLESADYNKEVPSAYPLRPGEIELEINSPRDNNYQKKPTLKDYDGSRSSSRISEDETHRYLVDDIDLRAIKSSPKEANLGLPPQVNPASITAIGDAKVNLLQASNFVVKKPKKKETIDPPPNRNQSEKKRTVSAQKSAPETAEPPSNVLMLAEDANQNDLRQKRHRLTIKAKYYRKHLEEMEYYRKKIALVEQMLFSGQGSDEDNSEEDNENAIFYQKKAWFSENEDNSFDLTLKNNQIEIKRSKIRKSNFNQDIIFRKAVLNNADMTNVEKFEDNYLQMKYGGLYQNLKQEKPEALSAAVRSQQKITSEFLRVLRVSQIPSKIFIGILANFERQVSQELLPPGSFIKFLIGKAGKGPWYFADELFPEENQIYNAVDLLEISQGEQINNNLAVSLKKSLENLGTSIYQADFKGKFSKNSRWDIYACHFKNKDDRTPLSKGPSRSISSISPVIEKCLMMVFIKKERPKSNDVMEWNSPKLRDLKKITKRDQINDKGDNATTWLPPSDLEEFLNDLKYIINNEKKRFFKKLSRGHSKLTDNRPRVLYSD